MPSLDTNVLVRDIVQDDPSQHAAAERFTSRGVAEGGALVVPVTVVLELEWVRDGQLQRKPSSGSSTGSTSKRSRS